MMTREQGKNGGGARMGFSGVLFDFDGVLGRTMEDNYRAWAHAFSSRGIRFVKEDYFLIEGFSARRVAEHFAGGAREGHLIESLVSLKEEFYRNNCVFSLYEGVEEIVDGLRGKGYRLGLVSGANFARLSRSVGKAFLDSFDTVVTADRVDRCKPHPEPYLKAASALGFAPAECVVVENAPMGIEAAKSAGMRCIAISSTLDSRYLGEADMVIGAFSELAGLL
ncbi:MAG: HAD family hydrolase [Thermodesulfobacteriota bacterium]